MYITIVCLRSPGSHYFANNSHYEANTAKNLLYHREARQMPETIKKSTSVGAST